MSDGIETIHGMPVKKEGRTTLFYVRHFNNGEWMTRSPLLSSREKCNDYAREYSRITGHSLDDMIVVEAESHIIETIHRITQ